MVEEKGICAIPGCKNTLDKEQRKKNLPVCSECEAAKMHICEACGKKISSKRLKEGATLCKTCEINPTNFKEIESEAYEYEPEDYMI